MPRKRMIDPGIWTDDDLGRLGFAERLLFIGLFSLADDEGLIRGSAFYLKAAVFPYDDISIEDVQAIRDGLLGGITSLELFEADDGKEYIRLLHWTNYQRIDRPSPSRIPRTGRTKTAIPNHVRREVAERYGVLKDGDRATAKCHYCGVEGSISRFGSWVHFSGLELDHIVPESQGGTHSAENIVLACTPCNRRRGDGIDRSSTNTSRIPSDDRNTIEDKRIEDKRIEGSPIPPEPDRLEIFNCWNSKDIIKHRKLTDKIRRSINGALGNYTQAEVVQAIDNYARILASKDHWFTYKWTLPDFLQRGLDKFIDWRVCDANYKGDEKRGGSARALPTEYEQPPIYTRPLLKD